MRGGSAGRTSVVSGKPALPRVGAWFQLWPAQFYGKSRKVGFCPGASAVADYCGSPDGLCADAEPVGIVGQFAGCGEHHQPGNRSTAECATPLPFDSSISLAASGLVIPPETVGVGPGTGAVVVSAERRGSVVWLRLRLADDTELYAVTTAASHPRAGDQVAVTVAGNRSVAIESDDDLQQAAERLSTD